MRPSIENALSVGCVVIAVYLMVPSLCGGPLVLDEHAAYWLSASGDGLSIWERNSRYAAAPPLTCWFQAASMRVLGETETAIRLPSVVPFIAAVTIMAFGFRWYIGPRASVFAACVLALHPDALDEVRIGRTYGFVVLWTTLLLLVTLRWQLATVRVRDGLGWGLIGAACVWTHILTIPVVACSAIILVICDIVRGRGLSTGTVAGWVVAGVLSLPLLPMGERIWEWRHALNYQMGNASIADAVGTVVWISLPLAAVCALVATRIGRNAGEFKSASAAIGICAAMALVPLLCLVIAGQGDLSSLSHPRYRVPLAAGNACLVGLLCNLIRSSAVSWGCLALCVVAPWFVLGRSPTQPVRLATIQAPIWKEMAQTLDQVVREENLTSAPIFVQSGLIEATLIPAFPDDLEFHAYVSSRMGRFYAKVDNPRYALPMFWGGDDRAMMAFFEQVLRRAASDQHGDVFVAGATDTDINQASLATFVQILEQFGYKGTLISEYKPWAALHRFHRRSSPRVRTDSESALDSP